MIHSDAPKVVQHTKPPDDATRAEIVEWNPYKSRYGDTWEVELEKILSQVVCVTKMITHMMKATEKAYVGTKYADSWMVYHDTLSLMTAKESKAWMKTQFIDVDAPDNEKVSYFDKWILPEMELNDEFVYFKGKPVGNSPEMMPLDNCLNKDIHESVSQHVLVSLASGGSLDKDDVCFFR